MKNYHKSIIVFFVGIILSYLFTSYIVGSFDISVLTPVSKVIQLLIFICFQVVSNIIIHSEV